MFLQNLDEILKLINVGQEVAMQVNIYEAKTHFFQRVEAVSKGETVLIAKAGTPLAKLRRSLSRPGR